ncbi:hypothetical protein GCM10007939_08040 [Amylibacter marinus]|uniref:C2H2-type domain-containing protein n=1 Tax=Amylibacter marinus TaxID=1475483 RepID=A0ABQ5VTM7_9RHOB|nr:hypothetical protein GCM10007939_08040 [Amylibacter marinus]
MAYLKPASLTCPQCGLSGDVQFVVHLGPHSKPDDGPARRSIRRAGPYQKRGQTLICPVDQTQIWPKSNGGDI